MFSKTTADALDRSMMERCNGFTIQAVDIGEYPSAVVICRVAKSSAQVSAQCVRIATSRITPK
jgi:hypothetical protein